MEFQFLAKTAGVLWLFYLGSIASAMRWGSFDPIEAKAKAVLTACLAWGVLTFHVHWIPACVLLVSAFVMYFLAKKHLGG